MAAWWTALGLAAAALLKGCDELEEVHLGWLSMASVEHGFLVGGFIRKPWDFLWLIVVDNG